MLPLIPWPCNFVIVVIDYHGRKTAWTKSDTIFPYNYGSLSDSLGSELYALIVTLVCHKRSASQ